MGKKKGGVDACASEMADYAMELLSKLPESERDARIRAMERSASSLPSSPPSRGGPRVLPEPMTRGAASFRQRETTEALPKGAKA